MGVLSKVFGKKSFETLKGFEEELIKLQKRTKCEITALVGTGGRLKGLPLIYATESNDETILKKYSARLIEILNPINNLVENKEIKKFSLYFDDKMLYFKPIAENVCFLIITHENSSIMFLEQWIAKKASNFTDLFTKNEE